MGLSLSVSYSRHAAPSTDSVRTKSLAILRPPPEVAKLHHVKTKSVTSNVTFAQSLPIYTEERPYTWIRNIVFYDIHLSTSGYLQTYRYLLGICLHTAEVGSSSLPLPNEWKNFEKDKSQTNFAQNASADYCRLW
jgi:hypothetical protein